MAVKSDGWRTRIAFQRINLDGKTIDLQMVDYHDIAITICEFLTNERKFRRFQPHIVLKMLRSMQALVHMHHYALANDVDQQRSHLFRSRIRNTFSQISSLTQTLEFEGNTNISADEFKRLTQSAVEKLTAELESEN